MKSASLSQFPVSPWLARAVDALYTHNPADELVVQMRRLAAAVEFSQARNPGYYDLMGARDASPSVFDTTDDAAALAAATRLLKDAGRGVEAASPLRTLFLSLRFTGQLQIGSASSMFLKEPRAYEGAFRENCHQMTVSLSSQWESLLAYTEAEQLLDQTKESFLQRVREELAERLEKNRAQMRTFPAFLDEDMTIDTGVDEKER